mmetsp:Transcript_10787/g.20881  ORF Transcript_10787/g.20881 Transcript_10787/m.20881 type:complete len:115 (+) Transcript_10787:754-1098(+)
MNLRRWCCPDLSARSPVCPRGSALHPPPESPQSAAAPVTDLSVRCAEVVSGQQPGVGGGRGDTDEERAVGKQIIKQTVHLMERKRETGEKVKHAHLLHLSLFLQPAVPASPRFG